MHIAEGVYDSQRVVGDLTGTHYTVMILETVADTPLGDWALVQYEQWFLVELVLVEPTLECLWVLNVRMTMRLLLRSFLQKMPWWISVERKVEGY